MSNPKYLSLILLFLFLSKGAKSQYIELGASLGVATYQGDINPLAWRLSFQGARFAKGISAGYNFNQTIGVKVKFMDSFLEAYDNDGLSAGRQARNLHFKTDLKEVSLVVEAELLNVIPWFNKWKYRPYVSAGVAVFKFNPQAKLNGIWHELQPLGTEGQGLPGSDKDLYSLTQISFPLGAGIRYHVNKNFIVSFEISPRITFTDYLDDVSDRYPDLDLLREYRGEIAYDIAYQGDVLDSRVDPSSLSGGQRGNPHENDWYITSSITFTYRLDPEFTVSKKHKFAGYYHCPFER